MNCMTRVAPRVVVSPLTRLFEDAFSDSFFHPIEGQDTLTADILPLDVSENEKELVVRGNLPGFRKEDINVEVQDGVLSISATRTEESEQKGERFYRRERRMGTLARRVALPFEVQDDAVHAEFRDGVLTLRLPRSPKTMPRKVSIN
jgi:HSP20 family protein